VLGMVDMEKLAVRKKDYKDIGLKRGETKVDPLNYGGGKCKSTRATLTPRRAGPSGSRISAIRRNAAEGQNRCAR